MNLDLQIPLIEGDINQLRQIIMNLITNASDALEDKEGSIIIASGKSSLSEKDFFTDTFICSEHIQTGEFVYLEVTDTGCGMDEETKSKIFDPFFTTKFTGRGLGLAAVLGIVRGHNGAIKVESESGMGSTFTVLFPVSRTIEETQVVKTEKNYNDWTGNGTILLVDDEESVLKIAKRMLEMIGFSVITASDGKQAIEIFTDRQDEIALIMLDMKMPRMDGPQAFKEIRRIKPDTLILVSSGYTESEAENTFEGDAPVGFIQKPYKFNSLKAKFYEILG